MTNKIDLKEDYKPIFSASTKEVTFVGIPSFNFLMIDGQGDPNTAVAFKESVKALYAVAYAIKFACKSGKDTYDFVVPPLEGLWWCDNMEEFSINEKDKWSWTLMIMLPDYVTEDIFIAAKQKSIDNKEAKFAENVRFELFDEGASAQIMHIGPYSAEEPTVASLHKVVLSSGYVFAGKHHEIYLSDARKTAPEKLKTIIRIPIKKKVVEEK